MGLDIAPSNTDRVRSGEGNSREVAGLVIASGHLRVCRVLATVYSPIGSVDEALQRHVMLYGSPSSSEIVALFAQLREDRELQQSENLHC